MVRYLLLLIIVFNLTIISAKSLQYEYTFENPKIINGKVILKDCQTITKPFVPAVCVKSITLYLGKSKNIENLIIDYEEPQIIKLKTTDSLLSVSPSGRLSVEPPVNIRNVKSAVFEKNDFFPAIPNDKQIKYSVQYKNGHAILFTVLFPVQYNPIKKEIKIYKKIILSYEVTSKQLNLPVKSNENIKKELYTLVDNKNNFDTLYKQAVKTNKTINDYNYLIITPPALKDYYSDFVSFNMERGLLTRIIDTDSISIVSTGIDLPEKIRNFIKSEYAQYSLEYVLLAGDNDLLPHRGFKSEILDYGTDYYNETDIPADIYFGCLDGEWKLDGSSYYGEPGSEDLLFEVKVGRFSVDNEIELQNLIDKTISYTKNPVPEKILNCALLGEFLWSEDQGENFINTWGKQYMEELRDSSNTNGYSTQGLNSKMNISTLYDYPITSYYNGNWNGSDLINLVNNTGISIINHLGHSNTTYSMKLSNQSITDNNFLNNGMNNNFLIIYSQGCYSASFDNRTSSGTYGSDCIGEKFTLIQNGAVAYLGNSRYGLGSPFDTNGSGQRFHRAFWDGLYNNYGQSLGAMNNYSKEVNTSFILEQDVNNPPYFGQCRWISYCVNLLGDPALEVWNNQIEEYNEKVPENITTNELEINIPPNSRVLITAENDTRILYQNLNVQDSYLFINENSFSSYIDSIKTGSFKLYIKQPKCKPFNKEINFDTTTKINEEPNLLPNKSSLKAFPNPFNNNCTIEYSLTNMESVTLSIYNSQGQMLKILVHEQKKSGNYQASFDGSNYKSGVYYCELKTGVNTIITKLVLIK